MRRAKTLELLSTKAARRCVRLRMLVASSATPVSSQSQRRLSYAVIEAANLWAQYCRFYYISTALRAKDRSGNRVSIQAASIRNAADAVTVAVHATKPKLSSKPGPFSWFDEPKWHLVDDFLDVLRRVSSSNLSTVQSALSYQPMSLRHLIVARNFFAHKSERTASNVRKLGPDYQLPADLAPAELLCTVSPRGSQPIVLDWLDDMYSTFEYMVP